MRVPWVPAFFRAGERHAFLMVEFDCGECGNPLVTVASTVRGFGPYPTTFLTCPGCGSAWEQGGDGVLTKKRKRVDLPVPD